MHTIDKVVNEILKFTDEKTDYKKSLSKIKTAAYYIQDLRARKTITIQVVVNDEDNFYNSLDASTSVIEWKLV